jgi:hypothetical protein
MLEKGEERLMLYSGIVPALHSAQLNPVEALLASTDLAPEDVFYLHAGPTKG